MSRPVRLLFSLTLLTASLTLPACKTIYSDMYSPRRSRFVPPVRKVDSTPATPQPAGPVVVAPDPTNAALGAPVIPGNAAPAIPGL